MPAKVATNYAVCSLASFPETIVEELFLSKKEHNWTWIINILVCIILV